LVPEEAHAQKKKKVYMVNLVNYMTVDRERKKKGEVWGHLGH